MHIYLTRLEYLDSHSNYFIKKVSFFIIIIINFKYNEFAKYFFFHFIINIIIIIIIIIL